LCGQVLFDGYCYRRKKRHFTGNRLKPDTQKESFRDPKFPDEGGNWVKDGADLSVEMAGIIAQPYLSASTLVKEYAYPPRKKTRLLTSDGDTISNSKKS